MQDGSDLSRRDFLGTGAAALGAAGLARQSAPQAPPKEKALNYNPKMEYRLWGGRTCGSPRSAWGATGSA